jgi:DNA-binding SARP family transcriptional activator
MEDSRQAILRFHLLGLPTITWDDEVVVIPRRSVRALLFRLASEVEPVSRSQLHLLFWADVPESVARRNLSHHLTHLRRALPEPQILTATTDRVWLEADKVWCDAVALKGASFDNSEDKSHLQFLAGLYHSPFLESFNLPGCVEFEHWCLGERNRLERQYLKILASLVEYFSIRGEIKRAIRYAQQFLETDPLSEAIYQQLIQLHASLGDRHAALQHYTLCSTILQSELGVNPLPETRAIYQAVLHGEHRFPKPELPADIPSLPEMKIPFISRKAEIGVLEESIGKLSEGISQVVLISGEAGIGKSRLMQNFAERMQNRANVLWGAGRAGMQAIPYQPILDASRTMLGLAASVREHSPSKHSKEKSPNDLIEPIWLSEISRILPEVSLYYANLPPPLPLEPENARTRLFEALCHLTLSYAAQTDPLLFCLDDLQWVDPTTKAWLIHIGHLLSSGDHGLMILGSYRSEDASEVLELRRSLAREGILVEIRLGGLEETALLELVRNHIGRRKGDVTLARRLHQVTDGNPYYTIETLRKLIEDGRLENIEDHAFQFAIPENVKEAIQGRLQRLSPMARQVLEAGSILGSSFGIDLLRVTAGRSHRETMAALDELLARILLVEGEQEYQFDHELTRQSVEESLGQVRKQILHRRAARAYQRIDPGAVTQLAFHFELGGDHLKALHYHEQAARKVKEVYAWQVVEHHQRRMLELIEAIDPGREQDEFIRWRGNVLAELAHTHYLLGQQTAKEADLAALNELGEACRDGAIRLQAISHKLRYLNLDGEYAQAITAARAGLDLLATSHFLASGEEIARETRARLLAQIGFSHYFLGNPLDAFSALREAMNLCEEKPNPEACGRIKHILGYVFYHLADYKQSLDCQQEALRCHREAGDHNRMAWDTIDIGLLHTKFGDLLDAKRFLEEGLELARRIGAQPTEAYGLVQLGDLSVCEGDYNGAIAYYEKSLDLEQAMRERNIIAMAKAGLGRTMYHLGKYRKSRMWLKEARQLVEETCYRRRLVEILIILGLLDMAEGSHHSARNNIESGLEQARACLAGECLIAGSAAMARLERNSGDTERALKRAMETVENARRTGLITLEMWGEIETGLAYLALNDPESALEHTSRGVELAIRAGQEWIGREEAHMAHASALRALGEEQAARQQDGYAAEIFRVKAALNSGLHKRGAVS